GSLLAGDADRMERARVVRRRLGGSMRQAGVLATAGLFALDHNVDRLADDHRRARRLADGMADLPGIRVVPTGTNIVIIDIRRRDLDAAELVRALEERGVRTSQFTNRRIRATTHLDVDDDGIARAIEAFQQVLGTGAAPTG